MTAQSSFNGGPAARTIELIAKLLEERTGQELTPNRGWRIDATLTPLLRERGLRDFHALATALRSSGDPTLVDAVVEALLNHETSFFRDAGVLDQVAEAATAMQSGLSRPLRVWSVGCSTGQEPLSLAMLFAEGMSGSVLPEIHASDVSATALGRARAARYTQFEVQRGLPIRRLLEWFEQAGQDWAVKAELANRVRYWRQNLVGDAPPQGRFDVILCRNVLLYFSAKTRGRALDVLAGALRPGGVLVLGAGETVTDHSDRLMPSERWRGFYTTAEPAQRYAA